MDTYDLERTAVVCDDEQFSCALVASVVEQRGFTVYTCASAPEAIELADEHDPDVVVIDLDLGDGPTGIDVLQRIMKKAPWVAGVLLTGHRSPRLVRKDLPVKLEGVPYLVKSDLRSAKELGAAIESAITGQLSTQSEPDDLPRLTNAQADLLRMIAEGMSNDQIARQRNCSLRSAERMIVRLYRTMGIPVSGEVNARVIAVRMYRDGQVTTR